MDIMQELSFLRREKDSRERMKMLLNLTSSELKEIMLLTWARYPEKLENNDYYMRESIITSLEFEDIGEYPRKISEKVLRLKGDIKILKRTHQEYLKDYERTKLSMHESRKVFLQNRNPETGKSYQKSRLRSFRCYVKYKDCETKLEVWQTRQERLEAYVKA